MWLSSNESSSSAVSSEESSISSESEESSSSLIPEPVETEAIYYDEECHYHERLDGQEPEKENHVFDGNRCTVCGYFTNKPNLLSLEYNEFFSVYNGEELIFSITNKFNVGVLVFASESIQVGDTVKVTCADKEKEVLVDKIFVELPY